MKESWKKEDRKDERKEGGKEGGRKKQGLENKPGWIHIWTQGQFTSKHKNLKDWGLEEEQVDVKEKERGRLCKPHFKAFPG